VITVYKVINMDIFLTKTHRFASEGLYLPLEPCGLLLWWMDALFWGYFL